jgi:succinyl-diaminopimelate desuccinylase
VDGPLATALGSPDRVEIFFGHARSIHAGNAFQPSPASVTASRCVHPGATFAAFMTLAPAPTADTLAELLATLVDIPSVTGNEAAISEFVLGRMRGRGGELHRSRNSLVWRTLSRNKPLVVLAGHLDTVPPNQNEKARREGDRLYGLGSTDMKGGDAVMLGLLETLDPAELRFDLALVFYEGEEGPAENNSLLRLLNEMPWLRDASLAILLEPTSVQVELGCNGTMNAEVRVPGKSAHSARPWTGVNAIEKAANWLAEVTKFPVQPVTIQGVEYKETLQVTTLHAGRARNVVPDELVANLNYRFPPDRTVADAERRMRSLVPTEFEVWIVDHAPPGKIYAEHPMVAEFVTRFGATTAGKQGWTDVARFTQAGIPAFNFGPGIPELAHQRDEYCPVENLGIAYRWLREYLTSEPR